MEDVFLKVASEHDIQVEAPAADLTKIRGHGFSPRAPFRHIALHPKERAARFPSQSDVVVEGEADFGDFSAATSRKRRSAFGATACFGLADNLVSVEV